jgi:hypothetical protein
MCDTTLEANITEDSSVLTQFPPMGVYVSERERECVLLCVYGCVYCCVCCRAVHMMLCLLYIYTLYHGSSVCRE